MPHEEHIRLIQEFGIGLTHQEQLIWIEENERTEDRTVANVRLCQRIILRS